MIEIVKSIYRLIRYPQQRKKIYLNRKITPIQNKEIALQYDKKTKNLIVFLVPGAQWDLGKEKISGGLISICSLFEETLKLKNIHNAEVIMVTHHEDGLIWKFDSFENNIQLFRINQLSDNFNNLDSLIFHVTEFLIERVLQNFEKKFKNWFKTIPTVHFNIMNQNIRLMPSVVVVNDLKKWANKITITTAHQRYCTLEKRNYYGVPIHKFSVWISPEQYFFKHKFEKENLMVVSPDPHPLKINILDRLKKIKGLEVRIIENLTYEAYKKLISRAKWSLTFGEGLDGYFIEPVFSGAISFAVFNELFFTQDFNSLQTLYSSIEEMELKIVNDIELMDNDDVMFKNYQKTQFDLCSYYYSKEKYLNNIKSFYNCKYTYV
jgi:hypothetical protein